MTAADKHETGAKVCTCGHDGLRADFHMTPCPIKVQLFAELRGARPATPPAVRTAEETCTCGAGRWATWHQSNCALSLRPATPPAVRAGDDDEGPSAKLIAQRKAEGWHCGRAFATGHCDEHPRRTGDGAAAVARVAAAMEAVMGQTDGEYLNEPWLERVARAAIAALSASPPVSGTAEGYHVELGGQVFTQAQWEALQPYIEGRANADSEDAARWVPPVSGTANREDVARWLRSKYALRDLDGSGTWLADADELLALGVGQPAAQSD